MSLIRGIDRACSITRGNEKRCIKLDRKELSGCLMTGARARASQQLFHTVFYFLIYLFSFLFSQLILAGGIHLTRKGIFSSMQPPRVISHFTLGVWPSGYP